MNAQWVRTGMSPMIGPLPAWIALPFPLLVVMFVVVGVGPAMVVQGGFIVAAIYLKSKGRSLTWVVRRFKTAVRGARISPRPLGVRRATSKDIQIQDFDFNTWRSQ